MSVIEWEIGESLLQMGARPAAILLVSPEGVLMIRWIDDCLPEDKSRVEWAMERGVRFGDLE